MIIIDILQKLGFSFWQLLVLVPLILFRKEIKELISNTRLIKFGDKEVNFSNAEVTIESIVNAKNEVSKLSDNTKAMGAIDAAIEKIVVLSLATIKRETKHLWPAIAKLSVENKVAVADIQENTFEIIRGNLKTLEEVGLIEYGIEFIGPEQYGLRRIHITMKEDKLIYLISEVEKKFQK